MKTKKVLSALFHVPRGTSSPPKPKRVATRLKVREDGTLTGLYTDAVNLGSIGPLTMRRASSIDFNHRTQMWEVFIPPLSRVVFTHRSRQVAIDWEHEYFTRQDSWPLTMSNYNSHRDRDPLGKKRKGPFYHGINGGIIDTYRTARRRNWWRNVLIEIVGWAAAFAALALVVIYLVKILNIILNIMAS